VPIDTLITVLSGLVSSRKQKSGLGIRQPGQKVVEGPNHWGPLEVLAMEHNVHNNT
jgi:hypothetical protein